MGGECYTPDALPPGKRPALIVLDPGWALEPVWMGLKNLAPTTF